MKIIKKMLVGASIGINIGLLMALFFSYLYGSKNFSPSSTTFTEHFDRPLSAVNVSIILWALMGIVFSLGSIIYQNDRYSITKQSVLHFTVTFTGFTFLAIIAGWFPLSVASLTFYTLTFILTYVITWWISMSIAKKTINRLNQELQK